MDFHDFPRILGKSGCESHPPPQVMCRPTSTYTPLANARQHAETHHKKRAFVAPGRIPQGPLLDVSAAEVVRARLSSCFALSSLVCGGLCKETHHKKRAFVAPGRISGSLAGRFCCRGGSCAAVFLFCVVEFSVRRIVQGVAQSLPRPRCRDAFPMKGVEQKL